MSSYIVYAIVSKVDGRIYVGLSSQLNIRLLEHNSGYVKSTQAYRPWAVFYTEEANTRLEARKREKYLKSGFGKEFLKAIRDSIRG
ncbi:MAG: GIY-YIG nuclease family protein [Patescibacteria group bacterium]